MSEQDQPFNQSEAQFSGQNLAAELEATVDRPPLDRLMFRDFFQTFRLSQGETSSQYGILKLLAESYCSEYPREQLDTALADARTRVEAMGPPSNKHIAVVNDAASFADSEAGKMWQEYYRLMVEPDHPDNHEMRPELIVGDILSREIYYQDEGRPNRTDQDDPYESVVREYILGSQLKGSSHLMMVKAQLAQTIAAARKPDFEEAWVTELLGTLATRWEAHHPAQKFFSENDTL